MLTCPDFSQCKIVVLGDVMLDRYWYGDTSRISPEAPVPVVHIERHEERVGGAANVAVNLQALGAQTTLIGAIGEDDSGKQLSQMLKTAGMNAKFVKPNMSTTLKLRVIGRHQQLIRLDFETQTPVHPQLIMDELKPFLLETNMLILSDYAKGMIAYPQEIIQYALQFGIKIVVDPKHPDLTVYRGASILTPNLNEFEAAVGECKTLQGIEEKGRNLLEKLACEALLITRGSQGMTLLQKRAAPLHIPAQAREVYDVTGAGDTVIAVLGASLACGKSYEQAAKLANLAAGIAVGRLGTATISCEEIKASFSDYMPHEATVLSEIERKKRHGEKIVMTNGCFDILHAGHITYLQQARALGNCLVVAVNDDHSVKRLKGKTRPINNLKHRMQVLAALKCVDYVVSFSEDTPEKLYQKFTPDILVKGGDYQVSEIAGAKHVLAHGGKVEILTFVEGCSTTRMIQKMSEEEVVV